MRRKPPVPIYYRVPGTVHATAAAAAAAVAVCDDKNVFVRVSGARTMAGPGRLSMFSCVVPCGHSCWCCFVIFVVLEHERCACGWVGGREGGRAGALRAKRGSILEYVKPDSVRRLL